MTQLAVANAAVEFGSTTLLDKVTFTIAAGEKWGVIGRNGAGKTTIFRLITGALQPTRGVVSRQPGLRVVLLEQHRDFGDARTVWEAVAGSLAELFELERSLEAQATRIGELGERADEAMLDRYARDLERFAREDGYALAARVDAVLHGLGFDPDAARVKELAHLSGGERGRVGLARQLVAPADVLLLDEPTNHLDLETTRWLERYLRETERTVVLVSHDREFLAEVVDHVLHVEHGTAYPYTGGYEAFVAQRTERRLAQQRSFDKQSKVVAAEEDYIRRNIAGVNTKQAKGRRKRLARLPRLSPPPGDDDTMALRLDVAERGGDQVVVAEQATVAIMDSQACVPRVLVEKLTAQIRRGDRVGLVGPNGAGKSTLLRTLMGEQPPAAGILRVGNSVTPAYYRQDLMQVPMDRTLYDVIQEVRPLWGRGQIQGHLGRFGFSGDEVQRRADTLSGGERARVALAMMVLSQANLLILDEPTNHLDVESIEALEDAIERYEGTVLLVSHDRALLRALTNRTWVLHERRVTTFDAGFGEWEAASAEREHAAAVRAAEEESLRKVHEKQRLQRQTPRPSERDRSQQRTARRAVEAAEQKVETAEARVAELMARLEDPALYATADGPKVAAELGRDLDRARTALDAALVEWTAASEAAEALVSGTA